MPMQQVAFFPLRGPVPTPRELGFRMPAEWELQESVWLVWPRDPLTWPGRVGKARESFIKAIQAVTSYQRVDLVVHPDLMAEAQGRLEYAGVKNVRYHAVDHQDSWIRDYGPLYLTKGTPERRERMAVKFQFNAWGNKYESLLKDRTVVPQLGAAVSAPMQEVAMVLEGGSIDQDGQGTALTTKQCLLNPNRNPDMSAQDIERHLEEYLNVKKLLWLGEGIQGDDTDGHVDDIARFCAPTLVAACVEEDRGHPNFQALDDNLHLLKTTPDSHKRPLRVVELPMPRDILDDEGKVLPASHANFLITNGVVLMPTFGGPTDAIAKARLQQCFKDRVVVGLDCRDLVWGMGGIHCLSQQMPAGKPAEQV
ncbi:MAG: agmatine deiminase family protein [Halobacteriales archaeon]|nr:agmatine deiminase family protein [Halobacteriales archaeon]